MRFLGETGDSLLFQIESQVFACGDSFEMRFTRSPSPHNVMSKYIDIYIENIYVGTITKLIYLDNELDDKRKYA